MCVPVRVCFAMFERIKRSKFNYVSAAFYDVQLDASLSHKSNTKIKCVPLLATAYITEVGHLEL